MSYYSLNKAGDRLSFSLVSDCCLSTLSTNTTCSFTLKKKAFMHYNALSLLLCVCSHTTTNTCGHSRKAETAATARFDSNLTTTNLQICLKYYTYICVRILLVLLLYMCPHTAIYFMQYDATTSPLMRFPRKKSHHQYHN